LLRKLGNTSGAIPFYAIFPAGRPNEPILFDGPITQSQIIKALEKAGSSKSTADFSVDNGSSESSSFVNVKRDEAETSP